MRNSSKSNGRRSSNCNSNSNSHSSKQQQQQIASEHPRQRTSRIASLDLFAQPCRSAWDASGLFFFFFPFLLSFLFLQTQTTAILLSYPYWFKSNNWREQGSQSDPTLLLKKKIYYVNESAPCYLNKQLYEKNFFSKTVNTRLWLQQLPITGFGGVVSRYLFYTFPNFFFFFFLSDPETWWTNAFAKVFFFFFFFLFMFQLSDLDKRKNLKVLFPYWVNKKKSKCVNHYQFNNKKSEWFWNNFWDNFWGYELGNTSELTFFFWLGWGNVKLTGALKNSLRRISFKGILSKLQIYTLKPLRLESWIILND